MAGKRYWFGKIYLRQPNGKNWRASTLIGFYHFGLNLPVPALIVSFANKEINSG
jgi:hypothetical protein